MEGNRVFDQYDKTPTEGIPKVAALGERQDCSDLGRAEMILSFDLDDFMSPSKGGMDFVR